MAETWGKFLLRLCPLPMFLPWQHRRLNAPFVFFVIKASGEQILPGFNLELVLINMHIDRGGGGRTR